MVVIELSNGVFELKPRAHVNAILEMRNFVDRLPMGGQTDSQIDANCKKAISVQPCARASTIRKTKRRPTCVDLG